MASTNTSSRTVLILGYGPRAAPALKDKLLDEGYNIATVSRTAHPELDGVDRLLHVVADLSNVAEVDAAFKQATDKFGPVSTVIYNAYSLVPAPVPGSPFSIPVDQLAAAQNVSLMSAYRAAQLLIESTNGGHKHFLYLGNVLHKQGHAWPFGFTLGLGKASAAHMVEIGAKAYGKTGGPIFYHMWEINADGTPSLNALSPEGHADMASQLVHTTEQGENEVPFTSSKDGKATRAKKDLVFKTDW